METERISNIKATGDAIPITVRAIRKWKPYIRRNDVAYLLIDKYGDAIQANVHYLDKDYFEEKICLMSCYEIDNYICEHALPEMKSTDHPATIRLGTNVILNHMTNTQHLPQFYFSLCDYNQLCERVNKKDRLTDYAGRLDTATPDTTSNGTPVIRLNITDISGKAIEVTIWEEIMPRFNWETMEKTEAPIIIVLTSTKVTKFFDKIQLSSTAATHIYIDPPTDTVAALKSRFQQEEPETHATEPKQKPHQQSETITTISEIQHHRKTNREEDKNFICQATITDIATNTWFFRQCPECSRKMYPKNKKWSCGKHDDITEPKLLYTIGATITDSTGSAKVTVFNAAAKTLLGITCKTLVTEKGYEDPKIIPTDLHALKGKQAIMHIQHSKDSYNLKINKAKTTNMQSSLTNETPIAAETIYTPPPQPLQTTKGITETATAKRSLNFQDAGISETKKSRYPD